jgi:hypothetical protein
MTLLNHIEALEGFQSISNAKLPISKAYQVAQIIEQLKSVCEPFFKIRADKVAEINEKYADGKDLPEEITKSFQEEVQELLEQEVEVNIPKLDISGLNIEIPVKALGMCMPFISLEENESGSDTNNTNSSKA